MASPQRGVVQAFEQASLSIPLPSSHCSPARSTASPQSGNAQALLQASSLSLLPSSHASLGPTRPSPQRATRQAVHASVSEVLPSSHSSGGSVTPFPQAASLHSFVHPSLLSLLPSSHCSGAVVTPSPQRRVTQLPPTHMPAQGSLSTRTRSSPQSLTVALASQKRAPTGFPAHSATTGKQPPDNWSQLFPAGQGVSSRKAPLSQ